MARMIEIERAQAIMEQRFHDDRERHWRALLSVGCLAAPYCLVRPFWTPLFDRRGIDVLGGLIALVTIALVAGVPWHFAPGLAARDTRAARSRGRFAIDETPNW